MKIDLSKLEKPDYLGSVQKIYFLNNEYMLCETTTGGSVFDVGTIFFIPDNDKFRTAIRHKIYTLLNNKEYWDKVIEVFDINIDNDVLSLINTHHIGMVDKRTGEVFEKDFPPNPSKYVVVKRFNVIKPEMLKYGENILWDYTEIFKQKNYMIPLENIVRFGITPESSIYKKFLKMDNETKKQFLKSYGIENLEPWKFFKLPKIDFTTKYEPFDRALTYQEALYISGLKGKDFLNLIELCRLCSYFVQYFFNELGLELWDLKWEFAWDNGHFFVVDTIDTDSVRVTKKVKYNEKEYYVHFNKQAIRDYYIHYHKDWVEAISEAKAKAAKTGKDFKEYLKEKYPEPPKVDDDFILIQREKLETIFEFCLEKINSEIAQKRIESIAIKEIEYFLNRNAQ